MGQVLRFLASLLGAGAMGMIGGVGVIRLGGWLAGLTISEIATAAFFCGLTLAGIFVILTAAFLLSAMENAEEK